MTSFGFPAPPSSFYPPPLCVPSGRRKKMKTVYIVAGLLIMLVQGSWQRALQDTEETPRYSTVDEPVAAVRMKFERTMIGD